jgi:hypothetical protein
MVVCETRVGETVLTGPVEDRSALFGVIAQIEALGLELLELRQIPARPKSPESGDDRSPGRDQPEAESANRKSSLHAN